MNDKELSNNVHLLIHSLRLIPGYKSSEAERKLSRWVIERYKDECTECKEVGERLKNQPVKKEGIMEKLKDTLGGAE